VPRVLVIGSANVDFVVHVERRPAPGETVSEGTLLVNHGGKGANQTIPEVASPRRAAAELLRALVAGHLPRERAEPRALHGRNCDIPAVSAILKPWP
jgi:hypothetical protein